MRYSLVKLRVSLRDLAKLSVFGIDIINKTNSLWFPLSFSSDELDIQHMSAAMTYQEIPLFMWKEYCQNVIKLTSYI
jgi:hypothetical protein